jgi:glycosyltransferase involved in cell wall biosynthesis
MSNPSSSLVSVVIPALNEGDNLVDTVRYVLENSEWPQLEVIVADDGSTDGSPQKVISLDDPRLRVVTSENLGVAGARNHGAEGAQGEVLVFLDGHCYVPPGWLAPLVGALQHEGAALAGPAFTSIGDTRMCACGVTWQRPTLENVWLPCGEGVTPVPFHIGACQAVRAEIFRAVGGYDRGMTRWGSEDIELCLRLWLLGHRVYAQPATLVYHLFRTSRPYAVDMSQILYNRLRLALLHFEGDQLARVIQPVLGSYEAARALVQSYDSDLIDTRRKLFQARKHDMRWFCQVFGINI